MVALLFDIPLSLEIRALSRGSRLVLPTDVPSSILVGGFGANYFALRLPDPDEGHNLGL